MISYHLSLHTCFFPVALIASRNSELSQASTSPWRWTKGASGYLLASQRSRSTYIHPMP